MTAKQKDQHKGPHKVDREHTTDEPVLKPGESPNAQREEPTADPEKMTAKEREKKAQAIAGVDPDVHGPDVSAEEMKHPKIGQPGTSTKEPPAPGAAPQDGLSPKGREHITPGEAKLQDARRMTGAKQQTPGK